MSKGLIIGLSTFLVLSAIGLGVYFYSQRASGPELFETEHPVVTDIVKKTVATGAIRPRQEVQIKPQVSGVVEELFVEAGVQVVKGERLARIKLIPSEVNINTAQSNVELAKLRLQEARRELERQREVFQKNLDVETARVNYENAQQEEERQAALYDQGVISLQAYNQFKVDLSIAKAAYDNALITSQNSLKRFETEVSIRQQEYEAAVNNLQLLREGAASNSRQVANVVTSTVDGMVLDIPVEEGYSVIERNNFNEGTSIAVIADMNNLIFEGQVDEADVGKLREGMPLELTVGAIEGLRFDAVLEYVSPKGEDVDGTVKFEVRAAIKPTQDVFLRAGYSANADIILDRRENVMAIKERDVIFDDDTTWVEVQVGEQQFERRLVKLGISDGIQVEVLEGIDTTAQIKVL